MTTFQLFRIGGTVMSILSVLMLLWVGLILLWRNNAANRRLIAVPVITLLPSLVMYEMGTCHHQYSGLMLLAMLLDFQLIRWMKSGILKGSRIST